MPNSKADHPRGLVQGTEPPPPEKAGVEKPGGPWRGYWSRIRQDLRFIGVYLPICLAPLALITALGAIQPAQPRERLALEVSALSSALLVAVVYSLHRQRMAFAALSRQLRNLSRTDQLTGLLNRWALWERLGDEMRRANRQQAALTLMLIDLNNFKKVNDQYGHPVGDAVLQLFGRILHRETRRGQDASFRIGGDEFVVLFSSTEPNEVVAVATRINERFAKEAQGAVAGLTLTCSIGIAKYRADDTADALVWRADRAMYQAKEADQVVAVATPPDA